MIPAVTFQRIARLSAPLVYVLPVVLLIACGTSQRGDAAPDAANAPAGGAVTLWTDSTELFLEHPALIVGAPDKFAVHLTDVTDFAPLRSGRITMRFVPRGGGAPLVVEQAAPRSPGIYGPSPEFTTAGVYDLTILVDSPQARDSITVPGMRVYPNVEAAPRDSGGAEEGVVFLKEQQWKTPGFRTAFAVAGSVAAIIGASGEIRAAAGRLADVTAPISGLVDAGGVASSPVPGARVERGQALAFLTPSLSDGGAAFAAARAELSDAEQEHARAARLFAVEAVPQRRVVEAENRLRAAREALAGLGGGTLSANGKVAVPAPITGVIARRSITPGSRVEAGAPLFTIVDPSVVWLAVHVPAALAARVTGASGATFQVEGSERRYVARRAVSVGSVVDSLSRTVPVLFEVANADASIKVGSAARVAVTTSQRAPGVVIPSDAILDEDGRAIVYVQVQGERFEKRDVTVAGIEGARAAVTSGVRAGERVVSGAAYQVRLASLSTAVPAHGHEH